MSPIIQTVVTGVLVAIIASLLTFFVTTLSNKEWLHKIVSSKIDKQIEIHNKIAHVQNVYDVIKEHEGSCEAFTDIREVKEKMIALQVGVIFLVKEAGGNPKDLGLI